MNLSLLEKTVFLSHKKDDSTSQEIKNLVAKTLVDIGIGFWDSDQDISLGQTFNNFANKIASDEVKIVILCCSQKYRECYENEIGGVGDEAKKINSTMDSLYTVIPIFKETNDIPNQFSNAFGITLFAGYPTNEHELVLKGHLEKFFGNINNVKTSKIKANFINEDIKRNEKAEKIMNLLAPKNSEPLVDLVNYDIAPIEQISNFVMHNAKTFTFLTNELNDLIEKNKTTSINHQKKQLLFRKKIEKQLTILINEVTISDEIHENIFATVNVCNSMLTIAKKHSNTPEIQDFFGVVKKTCNAADSLVDAVIAILENLSNFNASISNLDEAKIHIGIYADVFNKYSSEMDKIVYSYFKWLGEN